MFIITQIKPGCYGKKQITHTHARTITHTHTQNLSIQQNYRIRIKKIPGGYFLCTFIVHIFQHFLNIVVVDGIVVETFFDFVEMTISVSGRNV